MYFYPGIIPVYPGIIPGRWVFQPRQKRRNGSESSLSNPGSNQSPPAELAGSRKRVLRGLRATGLQSAERGQELAL